MSENNNIVPICKDCVKEKFPYKGTYTPDDIKQGDFVKLCFEDKEHIWVLVKAVEKKGIRGVLDNIPVFLDLKCGQEVFVEYKEIEAVLVS